MAKAQYVGVNGVARKVKQPYIGVDGVARKVKSGYVGVNGVARQFFSSGTPISEVTLGETVLLNMNGVPTEFTVVHQGLPSTTYDSSCNGTWLLKTYANESRVWTISGGNNYEKSDIHSYLNGTFLGQFDSGIQSIIKQVKIPYTKGTGGNNSLLTGSNGLSTKVFLLSSTETNNKDNVNTEGAELAYFHNHRDWYLLIAYSGNPMTSGDVYPVQWWTRSPYQPQYKFAYVNCIASEYTSMEGITRGMVQCNESHYVRPALILPSSTSVVFDDWDWGWKVV